MRTLVAAALVAAVCSPAAAADVSKPISVLQCLSVMKGLDAIGCVGKQLDGQACAPDAKQYKLGPLRVTIGMDLNRLQDLANVVQRGQNGFVAELTPLDPKATDAEKQARGNQIQANWNKIIDADCPVTLGRLPQAALKIGDGPEENPIPPAVIGALWPIIDQDK